MIGLCFSAHYKMPTTSSLAESHCPAKHLLWKEHTHCPCLSLIRALAQAIVSLSVLDLHCLMRVFVSASVLSLQTNYQVNLVSLTPVMWTRLKDKCWMRSVSHSSLPYLEHLNGQHFSQSLCKGWYESLADNNNVFVLSFSDIWYDQLQYLLLY